MTFFQIQFDFWYDYVWIIVVSAYPVVETL
jgi:hypothetical protein